VKDKLLTKALKNANEDKKRLVVPLVGFPGVSITGSTIKLAQQNYDEHFRVIKANVETFQPDAVFPLMDLSVEANALGMYTVFPKEESATVVKDEFKNEDLKFLEKINIEYDMRLLGYVEVVKKMKAELPDSILIGAYVTGPYTLAGLLLGADQAALKSVLDPDELNAICRVMNEKIKNYIKLLVEAGAQMICVLEPSVVMLGPEQLEQFSGRYVKNIVDSYSDTDIAMIYHICGNTMPLLDKMCETGVNALSIDSAEAGVNLPEAAKRVPEDVIIIGNINPTGKILNGIPSEVEKEVNDLLVNMSEFPNFILSTGCDLPQETPIENINAFMKVGREYKLLDEVNKE